MERTGKGQGVHVGAFGKHPGWDDHIDDQGLDTALLTELKSLLYVRGMSGNIDSGAWEALAPTARLEGFDHVFVWRTESGVVVGRFWSSSDGKGRKKYPMVVCAQSDEIDLAWACRRALPRLEVLEEECREATTASDVIGAVDRAREDLRSGNGGQEGASGSGDLSATKRLADLEALGPSRQGMHRLLYAMERDMTAFRPVGGGSSSVRTSEARAQHERVPRGLDKPGEALLAWSEFFAEHLAQNVPVMLILPVRERFIDVLVGDPDVKQFSCIRSGEEAIPLTTDVPYTLDAETIAALNRVIDRSPQEIVEVSTGRGLRDAAGVARNALTTAFMRPKKQSSGGALKVAALVGGGLVLGAAAIWMLMQSGGDHASPSGVTEDQDEEEEAAGAFGPAERARWAAWCEEFDRWVRPLAKAEERRGLEQDEHLRTTLLAAVFDPALDPRVLAQDRRARLGRLAEDPPASVRTAAGIAATERAVARLEAVKNELSAENWPARRDVAALAVAAKARGWAALAESLERIAQGVTFDSASALASGAREIAAIGPRAAEAKARLERASEVASTLKASGVAPAARFEETLGPGLIGAGAAGTHGVEELIAALDRAIAKGAEVDEFIRNGWARVDHAVFAAESQFAQHERGQIDLAALDEWMFEARQPRFQALDPRDDPRPRVEEAIASIEGSISGARRDYGDVAAGRLSELAAHVERLRAELGDLRALTWTAGRRDEVMSRAEELHESIANLGREIERVKAEASVTFGQLVATLRETSSISATGSAAVDEAWRGGRDALLAMFSAESDLADLKIKAEALRAFLLGLEDGLRLSGSAWPECIDRVRMSAAVAARRDKALAQAINAAPWMDGEYAAGDASFVAAWEREKRAFESWVEESQRAAQSLAGAQRLVDDCRAWNEQVGGQSIASLVEAAKASPSWAEVSSAAEEALARVDGFRRIGEGTSAQVVAQKGLESPDGAAVVASWRALADRAEWPSGASELAMDWDLEARGRSAVRASLSAERAAEIERELDRGAMERWRRAAEHARTRVDLDDVLVRGGRFEQKPQLSSRVRFNALVSQLMRDVEGLEEDETIRKRVGEFVAACHGLDGGEPEAARAWVAKLEAVANESADAGPALDFSQVGPGRAGWQPEASDDGDFVRYTKEGTNATLDFIRIDPPEGSESETPFFLGASELTVEQAGSLLDGAEWGELASKWRQLETARTPGAGQPREPQSWRWSEVDRRIIPAATWVEEKGGRNAAIYAPGVEVGAPTGATPLNMVSALAAERLAAASGCRLPTTAEWRTAYDLWGTSGRSNLRDATWKRQLEHAKGIHGYTTQLWPDTGVFEPGALRGSVKQLGDAEAVTEVDDGVLWLAPASGAADGRVEHLVGNVAELVMDEPGKFLVIGGSAMSAPQVKVDEPYAVEAMRRSSGWSDVGVRLAFGTDGVDVRQPVRSQVRRLLASAPFVSPQD